MKLNLTDLHISSLIVAFYRVLETKRNGYFPSTSLIQDPFSSTILDSLAPTHLDLQYKLRANITALDTFLHCIAIRTRFIDDWMSEDVTLENLRRDRIHSSALSSFSSLSNTESHCNDPNSFNTDNQNEHKSQRQIVNLNAGFCTRPYRLSYRNHFIVYEVDDVTVLQAKARILKHHHGEPNIPVHHVHGDLRNIKSCINQLIQSGFDPNIPTDWIAEGVIDCLEPQDILQLLYSLKKISCLGSRIAICWVEPLVKHYLSNIVGVKKDGLNLSWKTFLPKDVGMQMLQDSGWSNVHSLGDEEAWETYRRAQNLPIFILTAEVCNVLKDMDEMDRFKRIETRTNLYLDPSFVKSVRTLR